MNPAGAKKMRAENGNKSGKKGNKIEADTMAVCEFKSSGSHRGP